MTSSTCVPVGVIVGAVFRRGDLLPDNLKVVRPWAGLRRGDRLAWRDADGAYDVVAGAACGYALLPHAARRLLRAGIVEDAV